MKLLVALFALLAFAVEPVTKPISEIHALKFELANAHEQLAQVALQNAQEEKRALFVEICKAAGIEAQNLKSLMAVCLPDLSARTVTRVEARIEAKK